jgi:hypothetical protein
VTPSPPSFTQHHQPTLLPTQVDNFAEDLAKNESAVSMHTQEAKQQSKQLLKKGEPGNVKAEVHASRTKNMVLTFFNSTCPAGSISELQVHHQGPAEVF